MPLSLPSKDEILKALSNSSSNHYLRQLLLQTIQYGTDAGEKEPSLEDRTANATELLVSLFSERSDENSDSMEEDLVDVLWLISCTMQQAPQAEEKEEASPELQLTNALVSIVENIIPLASSNFAVQLQSHLDPSLLETMKLVPSEKEMMKKLRLLNTKNYRQQKFNLLQEESEGYAKALHLMLHSTTWDSQEMEQPIRSLIGTFQLDPNRVLDLALDVLESKLFRTVNKASSAASITTKTPTTSQKPNLEWLKQFSLIKIPPLIAFKLKHISETDSFRILQVIAHLAQYKLLDLVEMALYLDSVSGEVEKTYSQFKMMERKRVRSVGRVSLTGSSSSSNQQDLVKLKAVQEALEKLGKTHRIQLLQILLENREWDLVRTLVSEPELKKLFHLFAPLGLAVCDLVHERIQPFYSFLVKTPQWGNNPSADNINEPHAHSKTEDDPMEIDDSGAADTDKGTITLDQFVDMVAGPLLCTIDAGSIALRPVLYCKLCRLFQALLSREKDIVAVLEKHPSFQNFLKSFLIPSLSLYSANPALSMELWSILKLLPYTTRYRLYGDWRGVGLERDALMGSKPLVFVECEMHAGKDARYVLKRLSKDTIRETSRQIAKVTHSNPLVVFTTVLLQIESYDNLVEVMVDAVRFVSPLSLDVLSYCILSRLIGSGSGGPSRSRSKDDGVNVSQWLQSMESFIGAFYARCPFVEFRGILHYLIRRIGDGHVLELGVLKSLLKTTGGWSFADYSPAASLSVTQIEGRSGSTALKRETMTFGVVEGFNMRASRQLRWILQNDDMGVSLLIFLALVRARIVFEDTSSRPKPIKLIGSLFDTTQVVMAMLLDYLTDSTDEQKNLDSGEKIHHRAILKCAKSMPSLVDLFKNFDIDMASAWMLCRPLVRESTPLFESKKEDKKDNANASEQDDPLSSFALNEVTQAAYKALLPESVWNDISPTLYEKFYILSSYDLNCPEIVYNTEISRLNKEVDRLAKQKESHQQNASSAGRGGPSVDDIDELERVKSVSSILASDLPKQKNHVAAVRSMMQSKMNLFFPQKESSVSSVKTFIAHCIFPRCMQGPDDAFFCAHFISLLHQIETPRFSTLHLFDELIPALSAALFGATEGEAASISILLWEIWKIIIRWRYDEEAFEKELLGKPGSMMVMAGGEKEGIKEEAVTSLSFDMYKDLFVKWHESIGASALGCLKSKDFVHTRPCLIVLTRMVKVFPSRPKLGNKLFKALEPLIDESNAFNDIRTAAQSYSMQLTRARTDGAWKEEDAAVVQARIKEEKAAAEMRKKKAEEQLEEMKRESEKISEEIGDGRDGRARGGRRSGDFGGRSGPDSRRDKSPPVSHSGINFEPPPRAPVVSGGRGTSAREPTDRRREAESRPTRDESGRGRGSGGRQEGNDASWNSRREDVEHRGLEGRWSDNGQRSGRGRQKRARSPSPAGDADGRDGSGGGGGGGGGRDGGHSSKRSRLESSSGGLHSQRSPGGGGGGGGRNSRR